MVYQYQRGAKEAAASVAAPPAGERVFTLEQVRPIVAKQISKATTGLRQQVAQAEVAQKAAEDAAHRAKRRAETAQDRAERLEQDLKATRAELTALRAHHAEPDPAVEQALQELKAERARLLQEVEKQTARAQEAAERVHRVDTHREEVAALREQLGRERQKVAALERSAVVVLAGQAPDSVEFEAAFSEEEQTRLLHRAAASIEILINARRAR